MLFKKYMLTSRRIDGEILEIKGFKVKFGVLEKKNPPPGKVLEISFWKRVQTLYMVVFINLVYMYVNVPSIPRQFAWEGSVNVHCSQ